MAVGLPLGVPVGVSVGVSVGVGGVVSSGALATSRVIVAPSAYLIPLAERAGVPVVHIPNVVDTAAYEGPPRRGGGTRLLWMRTFHHIYNPQLAVRAFEHVVAVHPEATLTLAGQDKGLLGEVRALVADRPWRDQVSFPGFLGPEQKVTTFAAHDVFLNTNRVDNAPVSVLEAAAAGMPIVATEVGGTKTTVLTRGSTPEATAKNARPSQPEMTKPPKNAGATLSGCPSISAASWKQASSSMSRVPTSMDLRCSPNLVRPLNSFWTDVTRILSLFKKSSGKSGSAWHVAIPNCLACSIV